MHGLRFGIHLTVLPVADLVKAGVLVDKSGFDSIWVPDHFTDLPPSGDKVDPWVVLTAIGVQTSHVMLSTDVTDVLRCQPTKLSHIVATLDDLTDGRAALGVGAGELMNLAAYGLPWEDPDTRIERLREAVQVIRLIWKSNRSNPVDFEGKFYKLNKAWLDQKPKQPSPPIYVGALGAHRSLRLVGEVADGWKPWLNTPETFQQRLKIIEEAANKAGRDINTIDRVAFLFVAATDDPWIKKKAVDTVKPEILMLTHKKVLKKLGFEVSIPPESTYAYQKSQPTEEVVSLVSREAQKMPDSVAEQFLGVGTPEEIIAKIERFVQAGATHIVIKDIIGLYISASLDRLKQTIKTFGEKIIPYFKEKS
jgi:alkanesulfonate monooxygenase SsuD/methylene tetrahydromethanopterin reductase-like flavin-dependent oxidoreductase (luciferase family)